MLGTARRRAMGPSEFNFSLIERYKNIFYYGARWRQKVASMLNVKNGAM